MARAAVKQAEAARDAAHTTWQDAQALIAAPSDLDVKIVAAEANLRVVEEQVKASQAAATAADLEMQLWARTVKSLEDGFDVGLPPIAGGGTRHVDAAPNKLGDARLQWNLASQRAWEAHAKVNTALAGQNTVRQSLADLRSQKADPLALEAQVDAAKSAADLAVAAVATAQANLAVLQAGAPAEQIAAAKAQVERADGTIRTLKTRREQAKVLGPETGRISELVLRTGEVAAQGAAIVRMYRPDEATLTVYVPTPEMGQVQLGQRVGVIADSFPGRVFTGTVDTIAGHAEFTPKNVQTREERAGTVFPVKIKLANPEGVLKPGMPADAHFGYGGNGRVEERELVTTSPTLPLSSARFSGSIEATETAIAAEMSGRARKVALAQGDAVMAGQVAVELDGSEWQARRAEAEASVSAARAELARRDRAGAASAHRPGGGDFETGPDSARRGADWPGKCSNAARQAPGTRRADQCSTRPGRCGRCPDRRRTLTAQGSPRVAGKRPAEHWQRPGPHAARDVRSERRGDRGDSARR